jgi:flagellar biosynthesis/type III secretory pathway protein FliH
MSSAAFTNWHPRNLYVESEGSQPLPEELREHARQEGYAAGYTEGLAAGQKEAKLQGEELVARLMALIEDLDQPFRRSELSVSEYLLSVLQFACKTILRRELSADAEHITGTLERALDLLAGERGQVTVYLHPDDVSVVRGHLADEIDDLIMDLASVPGSPDDTGHRPEALSSSNIESTFARLEGEEHGD